METNEQEETGATKKQTPNANAESADKSAQPAKGSSDGDKETDDKADDAESSSDNHHKFQDFIDKIGINMNEGAGSGTGLM